MLNLQINNTSIAVVTGVKNALTGVVDNGATLTITLLDSEGVEVPPQAWPTPMFVEAPGQYGGTLQADLELSMNHTYTAVVDGVGSNGEIMHIRQPVKAVIRGGACT